MRLHAKNIVNTQSTLVSKADIMEKKTAQASIQHAGFIRALENRLQTLSFDICPPGTSPLHYFDQPQK